MLHGHLIVAWYRSIYKSVEFFMNFIQDIHSLLLGLLAIVISAREWVIRLDPG